MERKATKTIINIVIELFLSFLSYSIQDATVQASVFRDLASFIIPTICTRHVYDASSVKFIIMLYSAIHISVRSALPAPVVMRLPCVACTHHTNVVCLHAV